MHSTNCAALYTVSDSSGDVPRAAAPGKRSRRPPGAWTGTYEEESRP
jgi:hypothetical protein